MRYVVGATTPRFLSLLWLLGVIASAALVVRGMHTTFVMRGRGEMRNAMNGEEKRCRPLVDR
jgi:hypothetical protein